MPQISQFYGIIITMYYNDHVPPHFHARYAERKAEFAIADGKLLAGGVISEETARHYAVNRHALLSSTGPCHLR